MSRYCLYYWPQIPGRGEFVRLAFARAKVAFSEVNDISTLQQLTSPQEGKTGVPPHLAVPILEVQNGANRFYLSQTPAILHYLAPKLGLDGEQPGVDPEVTRSQVLQLALTGLDWAVEAHDVHHPIGVMLYYEEQKDEALRAAQAFRSERIPKFAKTCRLLGTKTSIADLVLFQVLEGLHFAFPHAMEKLASSTPQLGQFRRELSDELRAYLESPERRAFNDGLFRHYPELDPP
ncbi:glutathione transferase [Malassezia obtusa]|uniref:Glutathione transferase n=1 Tax=Malassezia obtusa TaxID=76774 RepID=A0AAF0IVY9_9BASI|nr:glutathione transferase [Malassezia obtusa]